MRTPLLAGLIAVLLPACLDNTIEGIGDTDGSDTGGDTGSGDGSGSGSDNQNQNQPHVSLSVDRSSVTSDLNVEQTITVTATSEMGFTGDVTLAVSAADGGTAITDWTTTLGSSTVSLTAGGTQTTTVKLSAMGDVGALTGALKVAATSSAGSTDATVNVTLNPVLVVSFTDNNGTCVYPTGHAVNNPWKIKAGRQVKVLNASATRRLVVHTNGGVTGFNHENNTGTAPGEGYMATVTAVDDQDEFYCHNPNDAGASMIEGAGSGTRNYLRVVQ